METNKNNTEKKDNPAFAFLPEMVIEHLNHSEPKEVKPIPNDAKKDEISNATMPQSIIFDPLADPFDGLDIENEPTKKNTESKKRENKIY